jgi:Low affinity iron permease
MCGAQMRTRWLTSQCCRRSTQQRSALAPLCSRILSRESGSRHRAVDRHRAADTAQGTALMRIAAAPCREAERLAAAAPRLASQVQHGNAFERMSARLSDALATGAALAASVCLIVLLLAAATAMRWNETGQLLANTPTMILEGGLLLVLMASQVSGARARLCVCV